MEHLYERLAVEVGKWRANGYPTPSDRYPAVAEILDWAGDTEAGGLRYLRRPQLVALETYWYLRLLERTPHIFDLYRRFWPPTEDRKGLLEALGVGDAAFRDANYDEDDLWERARADDEFVKKHRLESLRETLALDYPSYILALAMGAGKTVLIGAIVATEFAMAQEYPDGDFVHNALVFAPGKTIIESLRELTQVPYDKILPPRFHKAFSASVKLTFTRDGEKDVPVIRGSSWNIVVTNTEKIRIQKESIRRSDIGRLFDPRELDEAKAEIANLRLQAIASLPRLAMFSDEAHHTYGQSLEKGLKRVRQTVDYLAEQTSLVCVVNTTGTPYFKRQPLKDVVVWYGLSQGIRDGILKDLAGNIQAYDFAGQAGPYVAHVVKDFFAEYGKVALPDGSPAKLAMYFPQTDDLKELRPVIDQALAEVGESPTLCLVNTSDSSLTKPADIEAFNRLNDPRSPHRVILLVNKGTEGWNCPSLFACALARKLKTSNNFVLQAASRCLRQVPGNAKPARVYLSTDNYNILDRQLRETYGERIEDLNRDAVERRSARLVLRKLAVPPLVVTQLVRTVVRKDAELAGIELELPATKAGRGLVERTYTLSEQHVGRRVLRQIDDAVTIETVPDSADAYSVAVDLAGQYRLDVWAIYDELRRIYGPDDIPVAHMPELARQLEDLVRDYEVREETVERALALVRPEAFSVEVDAHGTEVYTADIVYPKGREHLLVSMGELGKDGGGGYGFHYDPYNFDSNPEKSFFLEVLGLLDLQPSDVEDVYFTGGITDPAKTDFFVEYRDEKGKWRRYTPDFVIRKMPEPGGEPGSGRVLIVEIKAERDRTSPSGGEEGAKAMAVRKWEELNPDRIKYEIVFTKADIVAGDQMGFVREFVGTGKRPTHGPRISVDRAKIEDFCSRWKITEFSFFGSVLRDDFGPDSDVDVLVSFAEDAHWSLFDHFDMEEELGGLFGRKVDVVTRRSVEGSPNWIRRKAILESAEAYLVSG